MKIERRLYAQIWRDIARLQKLQAAADAGDEEALVAFHQTRAIRNPGGFEDRDYLALDIVKPGPIPSSDTLGQLLILCAPPGDYDSVGGELTLRLRNHSLFIGWYLYYFVDGIYHSLLIAD